MVLEKWVRFKVSKAALREMERRGGLDEYIMWLSDEQLGGEGSVGVVFKRGKIIGRYNIPHWCSYCVGLEHALAERNAAMEARHSLVVSPDQPEDEDLINNTQQQSTA
jgi:hypothetical protein